MVNIRTEKKDGKLYVYVELHAMKERSDLARFESTDVEEYLAENKIKHGKCLKHSVARNRNPNNRFGEWIYELPALAPKRKSRIKKDGPKGS